MTEPTDRPADDVTRPRDSSPAPSRPSAPGARTPSGVPEDAATRRPGPDGTETRPTGEPAPDAPGTAPVELSKGGTAVLPRNEQVPGEQLREGQHIKVYVVDVIEGDRGPRMMISRTHPGLVKRMFEMEVPEIFDGTVEVKAISREAGARTKMAVWSKDENVDPVGACIGPRGQRVAKIVDELGGEKIDIVRWSEDPAAFISAALSPANVVGVEILDGESKACRVTVPDHQLSLAIGNKGQNARLCARLTGYNIDIRPESGYYGEEPSSPAPEKESETAGEETAGLSEQTDAAQTEE